MYVKRIIKLLNLPTNHLLEISHYLCVMEQNNLLQFKRNFHFNPSEFNLFFHFFVQRDTIQIL